ncbi:MAG TPA: ABC transporter substrate-binding protein [Gemmatimonadaceae bacterium]|nr:ABC transporter substrate-binding protein [Gemmatimonadaceae bacterium]
MLNSKLKAVLLGTATAVLGACADTAAPAAGSRALALDVVVDSIDTPVGSEWMGPGAPDTLRLGYFSRSPVVAMAQRHGFFAAESLTVLEFQTPSSPVIFQRLRDGKWNLISTQIDNVFNYRFNASNPLGGTFDPTAIMGTDWGNGAALLARPEYPTVESLRGKTVAVDSPNSGFAFVLYGIMRAHGLEKGVDYNVIVTGGTPGRYADLVAGRFDATILNAGYQFRAEAAGMQVLGQMHDAVNPSMGGSVVALRGWLDQHQNTAVRFIRAYVGAQKYVLDPANRDEVIAWLTTDAGGNSMVALRSYQVLTTGGDGLIPDGAIDTQGVRAMAALRSSFGGFDVPQNIDWLATPASGVYDLGAWHLASASLNRGLTP